MKMLTCRILEDGQNDPRRRKTTDQVREWVTSSTTIFLYHYSEERFICEKKKWRCYGLCSLFYLNSLEKETQMYLVICSFIFCASPELSNFFKKWIFTKLFFYLIVHNYEENILGESSRDDSKTATGGWWAAVTFRKNLHPTPKELSCG